MMETGILHSQQTDKAAALTGRICITLEEAAELSHIGIVRMRKITSDPKCPFVLWIGESKRVVKVDPFRRWINEQKHID